MGETILAADVGGTHARLGLVEVIDEVQGQSMTLRVQSSAVFQCRDYADLGSICTAFLRDLSVTPPRRGVIAIAGLEVEDRIEGVNLPWTVYPHRTRQAVGLDELLFVNDFVAAALGVCELRETDVEPLRRSAEREKSEHRQPRLVIGPGTGLGAAALIPDAEEWFPVASEAGQAAFAPATELEFGLLQALKGEKDLLSIGELLSGPGLPRLDAYLRGAVQDTLRSPAEITQAAMQQQEPAARRALDMFCGLLGKVAGDLALIYKAQGGVYLVGGILPRIRPLLLSSGFLQQFEAKGAMRDYLRSIPVCLVDHAHLGILGAARWWIRERRGVIVDARRAQVRLASSFPITQDAERSTFLFREAAEAPQVVAVQLDRNALTVESIVRRLRSHPPRAVITCARGSSDHAATYARYLIDTRIGTLTSSVAPSVHSLYRAPSSLRDTLLIAISQSGASPDVLATVVAAKAAGAWTVALTNVESSPLASLADAVLPVGAGEEKSVAASKSFIASLSALLHLVGCWRKEPDLLEPLQSLPEKLQESWALDWTAAASHLMGRESLYIVGRGLGLGVAQEAALKFKETCGLHAEGYSAAELQHGPMALVNVGFPVLMFAQDDETREGLQAQAAVLAARGAQVLLAGGVAPGAQMLPTVPAHPVISPMLLIQRFYRLVNALSLARGWDPDRPPHLSKVTETL